MPIKHRKNFPWFPSIVSTSTYLFAGGQLNAAAAFLSQRAPICCIAKLEPIHATSNLQFPAPSPARRRTTSIPAPPAADPPKPRGLPCRRPPPPAPRAGGRWFRAGARRGRSGAPPAAPAPAITSADRRPKRQGWAGRPMRLSCGPVTINIVQRFCQA